MKFRDKWTAGCGMVFAGMFAVDLSIRFLLATNHDLLFLVPPLVFLVGAIIWHGWPFVTGKAEGSVEEIQQRLRLYLFGTLGIGMMGIAILFLA